MSEYLELIDEEDVDQLAIVIKTLDGKISERDRKVERQKAQIRRLEEGAKGRKNLIKKLHRKITELEKEIERLNKLQYDH